MGMRYAGGFDGPASDVGNPSANKGLEMPEIPVRSVIARVWSGVKEGNGEFS